MATQVPTIKDLRFTSEEDIIGTSTYYSTPADGGGVNEKTAVLPALPAGLLHKNLGDESNFDDVLEKNNVTAGGHRLLVSLQDKILGEFDISAKRCNKIATDAKGLQPWRLYKGSTDEKPRMVVPTACPTNSIVSLAYMLIYQLGDELDIIPLDNSEPISLAVSPDVEGMIDGICLALIKEKSINSASFGRLSNPVDKGFAIATAACAVNYCQKAGANRGYLLDCIPDCLKGTNIEKKYATELFGKVRSSFIKDESEFFVNSLIWLFNKWALTRAGTLGARVMRCQKIKWESIKRKSIPYKINKKKVKGRDIVSLEYSSPKNIGVPPLLSRVEKTVLKACSQIAYHDVLEELEHNWKTADASWQHDNYDNTISKVKNFYKEYSDAADKIVGRIYKRQQYFEKVTGTKLAISKKKKPEPRLIAKHLSDLSKEVFSSAELMKKIPLQTCGYVLLMNTHLQEIVDKREEIFSDSTDQRTQTLIKEFGAFADQYNALQLQTGATELIKHFQSTNQYALLGDGGDDDDDDEALASGG